MVHKGAGGRFEKGAVLEIVIDREAVDAYAEHYFAEHPRATKKPIDRPRHPLMNQWMIMRRPMMNAVKQKWKDFTCWLAERAGYAGAGIERCSMRFVTYYETNRRHDVDAACPKFILDGFAECGLIIDDDMEHLRPLVLDCAVDRDNPRTEIYITIC